MAVIVVENKAEIASSGASGSSRFINILKRVETSRLFKCLRGFYTSGDTAHHGFQKYISAMRIHTFSGRHISVCVSLYVHGFIDIDVLTWTYVRTAECKAWLLKRRVFYCLEPFPADDELGAIGECDEWCRRCIPGSAAGGNKEGQTSTLQRGLQSLQFCGRFSSVCCLSEAVDLLLIKGSANRASRNWVLCYLRKRTRIGS